MNSTFFDQIFRDSSGQIVIAQPPNPPLILWAGVSVLKFAFSDGEIGLLLDLLAFGALFTWAWQEIFEGVNYFRRALGLIVLLILISSTVSGKGYAI